MLKILLLDLDGVVIKGRQKYFSEKYSEEYGVSVDAILPFFKNEYKDAAVGKVDIKEILPTYLKKWGWEGTVEQFLDYWFESERDVDQRVAKVVRSLREKGVGVYLASDNETNRAKYVMDVVGLKDKFDGEFISARLGVTKSDPDFFKKVLKQLGVNPSEIEYWDDDPKNVEVAKQIGIKARVYSDFKEFSKAF